MAGFWTLYRASLLDYQSPIVNFGKNINLGTLEKEACRQLVSEPMAMLDIRYASKDLVEKIITETGQLANLIAIVCDEMLKNLANDQRVLNAEDVTRALHSWEVRTALATWMQLSDDEQINRLNRIIVYATVKRGKFRLSDVINVLKKQGCVYTNEQLSQSLNFLELAFIIRREEEYYSYCVPLFRKRLMKEELEILLEQESSLQKT